MILTDVNRLSRNILESILFIQYDSESWSIDNPLMPPFTSRVRVVSTGKPKHRNPGSNHRRYVNKLAINSKKELSIVDHFVISLKVMSVDLDVKKIKFHSKNIPQSNKMVAGLVLALGKNLAKYYPEWRVVYEK